MKKLLVSPRGRMLVAGALLIGFLIWVNSTPPPPEIIYPLPASISAPTLPSEGGSPSVLDQEASSLDPFFEYIVVVEAPHEDIEITLSQDYIYINAFFDRSYNVDYVYRGGGVNKNDYPKLFEKGDDRVNFKGVMAYEDKLNNKFFLILAKLKHDHFAYSYDYAIILDPETGEVVYETPDYFMEAGFPFLSKTDQAGVLRLDGSKSYYGYAESTRFEVMEFISYNPDKGKFVPVNKEFRKEFEELLAKDIEIEKKGCLYLGKVRPFEVIRQMGGNYARCEREAFPFEEFDFFPFVPLGEHYISMGEYYAMKQRIEDIIEGKAESMVP